MMDKLKKEDFEEIVNTAFQIQFSQDFRTSLYLIKVIDHSHKDHPKHIRKPFSLIFQSELLDKYYPQAIFKISHPQVGEMELFIVPIGPDPVKKGMQYEAVFN